MPVRSIRHLTSAERRERLLRAALTLFRRRGMAATTVADIAEKAGIAKGSFYTAFASKEELFAALRQQYVDRMLARAVQISNRLGSEDIWHLADEFIVALVDLEFDSRDLTEVFVREGMAPGASEAFADIDRRMHELIANGIRVGTAAGEFAVDDPWATAALLMHAVHGACRQGIMVDRSLTRDRIIAGARELTIRTLRGIRSH